MSLLTPERVPVKVYRWDDEGAPSLNKTAGCMMHIFKACLITGYGTKSAAGWTMPYEDLDAGIKVFRPAFNLQIDYYLRLSSDTGVDMSVRVYQGMTDIDTGDISIQPSSKYIYAKRDVSAQWMLIASPHGFIFFNQHNQKQVDAHSNLNQLGSYFYITSAAEAFDTNSPAVFLDYTAGIDSYLWAGIIRKQLHNSRHSIKTQIYQFAVDDNSELVLPSIFNALSNAHNLLAQQVIVIYGGSTYVLPGILYPSAYSQLINYDAVPEHVDYIAHGTSNFEPDMVLVNTQFWVY